MTVGQRISQKRKQLGLSQEALGEQMGVSRQAIYKWESDAALPEIEKLVTLSKIFGFTVGELLGVEEPAEQTGESGELTESQIKMAAEIAEKYQQSHPENKKKRWPAVTAGIVIAVMAVSLVSMRKHLNNLQNQYRNLQNSVVHIDDRVGDQIHSITSQVEEVLNRVNSFTTEQGSEISSIDFDAGTVTISMHATPKTYTEGMTARFVAECGDQIAEAEGIMGNTQDFSGSVTLPLTNDFIELSVTFMDGERQDIQPIGSCSGLYNSSFQWCSVNGCPLFFDVQEDVLTLREYELQIGFLEEGMPQAEIDREKTRMGLFKDGHILQWLEHTDRETVHAREEESLAFSGGQKTVSLDREASYCIAAVITDEYGREYVVSDTPIIRQGKDWTWADRLTDSSAFPENWEY